MNLLCNIQADSEYRCMLLLWEGRRRRAQSRQGVGEEAGHPRAKATLCCNLSLNHISGKEFLTSCVYPWATTDPHPPTWAVNLGAPWRLAAELKQSPRGASVLQDLSSLLCHALTTCFGLGRSELRAEIPQGKKTPPCQEMDSSDFLTWLFRHFHFSIYRSHSGASSDQLEGVTHPSPVPPFSPIFTWLSRAHGHLGRSEPCGSAQDEPIGFKGEKTKRKKIRQSSSLKTYLEEAEWRSVKRWMDPWMACATIL